MEFIKRNTPVKQLTPFETVMIDFESSEEKELVIAFKEGIDYCDISQLHNIMGDVKTMIRNYCNTSKNIDVEVLNHGNNLIIKKH